MSKVNNVLVDLRNKVGIAGKEFVKEYFFDLLDDIEGRNETAVQVTSIGLEVVQKAFLLHWVPRWI